MGRLLVKGGTVLSMDPDIGSLRQGDVLVEDGRIVVVAPAVEVEDCEVVDADGMVVMPSLVDAHRHLWYAGIRGGSMDAVLPDIVAAQWGKLGPAFTPGDVYAFTRAGIADCLDHGITTVFDWCHVINTPEHAEAAVEAHKNMPMRAVFGYGGSMDQKVREMEGAEVTNDWSHAATLLRREFTEQRLTMALALPGLDYASLETTTADVAEARHLGVPMSFHLGVPQGGPPKHSLRRMAEAGLLGPDMSFSHCCAVTDEEFEIAAAAGAKLMSCPVVDAATGMGAAPSGRMRRHGLRPCFAADSVVATSGDLFEEARVGLLLDRYEDSLATYAAGGAVETMTGRLTAREALDAVTTVAAGCCWLDAEVGSLSPGKQADLVLLRATDLNLWPLSNLESALVAGAHGGNVDTVLVAGRVVKRDGALVDVDTDGIRRELVQARDRLYAAAGFNDIVPS